MRITFNIEADSPTEMLQAIQGLAAGGIQLTAAPAQQAATVEVDKPETKKPVKQQATKPADVKSEPEKAPEPEKQPDPAPEKQPEKKAALTIEQVRGKLAELSQKGKQAQVKELIGKFGAQKLTDIPAEKYEELMKAAEELG